MPFHVTQGPKRIVCLTEEPTEILYLLGESERIVGISAYTVRPKEAKRDKPVVSAFIGGSVEKICALRPDLVIGFSDIQANLARDLVAANLQVVIFNQRSVQEILDVILNVGRLVNRQNEAKALVEKYVEHLESIAEQSSKRTFRPKVYFEEWDEPMITCIQWVGELIEIAGGDNIFSDKAKGKLAKERFVQWDDVMRAAPDVVFASWCGKPFDRIAFAKRPGVENLPAWQQRHIYELPPEQILQPGPACLTDGLALLCQRLQESVQK